MKKLLVVFVLLFTGIITAQEKGTVQGVLTDKEMGGEPLPFANVFVKGTTVGVTTDFDGNYTLNVDEGAWTIVFSFVGYETIEVPVTVVAGETIQLNKELSASQGVELEEISITANSTKKESAVALAKQQMKVTVIQESIGAQQLSEQAVSDAAGATAKVTGVSKQQGSSKVYVRGLGDRYNNTTLNGLPLPSNDPSLKNISLDLFSTDIIQNVGISKTSSSNITGDVAGANINIVSKQASSKSNFSVGISTGVNSQTSFKDFKTIDGANYAGIASDVKHPVSDLTKYNFNDNFSPNQSTALPKVGISVSGGKKYYIGGDDSDSSFSYFLVGSFSNNYRFVEGFNTNNQFVLSGGQVSKGSDFYDAKEYTYSTSKLAMGNFEYKINANHKILYNSIFIHSNSQKIQDYFGDTPDNDNVNVVLQTQNQNKLFINQLISKNKFGTRLDLDLALAFNNVKNDEPNRKKNVFLVNPTTGEARFATGSARNNSRYYHNLNENDLAAKLDGKFYLGERGEEETKGNVNFGYSFRNTKRDFEAFYFDHDRLSTTAIIDRDNVGGFLNQQGIDNGDFRLITGYGFGSTALDPFTYGGTRTINVANASLDYNLTEKLFANIGARLENINMEVNWATNLTGGRDQYAKIDQQYVLPSLNLKYSLNDENQLRLAVSQTYTFPQFKEIAEFVYEGVNYQEQGNKDLQPSENFNIDVKFERLSEKGNLFSATVFGKIIQNSINRIELNAASDNVFSYENTGDAEVYGLEVEYKTTLLTIGDEDEDEKISKLKLGANGTYMYTNQDFEATGLFSPTNSSAQLEGASPVILNSDISYAIENGDKKSIATIVLNYQADKLYSIGSKSGSVGLENIVQKSITTLDFVAKHQFNKKMGLKLSLKNLLNPSIERVRDLDTQLTNISFKRGIDASLSLTYKF